MHPLRIDPSLPHITATVRDHPAAILLATPGAGKTTRVPPALLPILPKDAPNLIMLQPRRVAARAAAQRIAEENNWRGGGLGHEVGYHIRFEKRYGPNTRIRILTEAILTRILLDDPYLESGGGIGCVILDEFHERNIHTDLALAFLREIQQTVRPDLKILVMSATLDPAPIAAFLHNAPILDIKGQVHPLEILYRPLRDKKLEDHLPSILDEALSHPDAGDILLFLPGRGEIERATTKIQHSAFSIQNCLLLPLHGFLSPEEQQRALRPDPQGRRKIILATNIAETSLTIDGVRTVIDAGLARIASFDPDRGMDRLDLQRISQASATQRAGRAARQAPGRAFRLWSELEQKHLPPFNLPEIERIDLAPNLLAVHAWGGNPRTFAWYEAPPEDRLAAAEDLLDLLGALHDGQLTPLGKQMQKLPLHPRLAKLLLAAGGMPLQEDALSLATLLSDDSRTSNRTNPLTTLDRIPPHLTRTRDQLARTLANSPPIENQKSKIENIQDLLLLAYPDRLARRRENDPYAAVMVGGSGLRIAADALTPALAATPLFIALDAHHDPRNKRAEATVRTAVPLEPSALERLFPEQLHTETALTYDVEKQKVLALTQRRFHDLVLHEDPHGPVDRARAGEVLAMALAPQARELFLQNEQAARLLARIALLRHYLPDAGFPALDEAGLQQLLHEACANKRSLAELTEGHALADAIRSALVYPLDRQLDQLAPETCEVPSGSRIKIDYQLPSTVEAAPPTPILAVRLQELFGLLDTPRIAAGRCPLLLHLLSPGFKPIQITQDLKSFWSSAYFEVRKDLRTRYPKHKWPEDPMTAIPEAKGRPHR